MQPVDFKALGFEYRRGDTSSVGIRCDSRHKFCIVVNIMVTSHLLTKSAGENFKKNYNVYERDSIICPIHLNGPAYGSWTNLDGKRDIIYSFEEFIDMINEPSIEKRLNNLNNLLERMEETYAKS